MRRRHLFSGAENFALFDFDQRRRLGRRERLRLHQPARRREGPDHLQQRLRRHLRQPADVHGHQRRSAPTNPHLVQQIPGREPGPGHRRRACGTSCATTSTAWSTCAPATNWPTRGFHTHLNGYQYRALVDFRPVTDHDGLWCRLAEHLAGRGAARSGPGPAPPGRRRGSGPGPPVDGPGHAGLAGNVRSPACHRRHR